MKDKKTKIWTDGGTPKNSQPFGEGYGSYRIGDNGPIITERFGLPMSNNAAEIFTMARAIAACQDYRIEIISDSRIGLKWAKLAQNKNITIPDNISESMKVAIDYIYKVAQGKKISCTWKPRFQIFEIFGH